MGLCKLALERYFVMTVMTSATTSGLLKGATTVGMIVSRVYLAFRATSSSSVLSKKPHLARSPIALRSSKNHFMTNWDWAKFKRLLAILSKVFNLIRIVTI